MSFTTIGQKMSEQWGVGRGQNLPSPIDKAHRLHNTTQAVIPK